LKCIDRRVFKEISNDKLVLSQFSLKLSMQGLQRSSRKVIKPVKKIAFLSADLLGKVYGGSAVAKCHSMRLGIHRVSVRKTTSLP